MGVPIFFRWLCTRNPKIIRDAEEPTETTFSNPYVDNFYVDMNGLIHPACNPKGENIKEPANFEEQCENIFVYLDTLINLVQPKKLLYLAIDGVAPRAKMNQQRSRRFRAAMEGAATELAKKELYEVYKTQQAVSPDIESYVNKKNFDSNLITPGMIEETKVTNNLYSGTQFLSDVSSAIRHYIRKRLNESSQWRNLTVIFSDANCPGEGEHKIMSFIREERSSESYNPQLTHCIYGADADLLFLSLVTHEPRFYIIREIVVTANDKWCTACGRKGHYFMDCRRASSIEEEAVISQQHNAHNVNVQFQYINVKIIREWLNLHFRNCKMHFEYNLERIIDDFVFMCFFVGNDFLPHVPCLSIREGGIDVLIKVYEFCLATMQGYITDCGSISLPNLQIYIAELKYYETELIEEIVEKELQMKYNNNRNVNNNNRNNANKNNVSNKNNNINYENPLESFKEEILKQTNPDLNIDSYSVFSHPIYNYKEKYYREKFRIHPTDFFSFRNEISTSYLEALHWILQYYYKGVVSWSWYYPFHYAPFFTDMSIEAIQPFTLSKPFRPFEQLMAVLPPQTIVAIPSSLRWLVTSPDSPIADYYPEKFVIDLVGKKFAWLGEVLLPFIDDERLLEAMGQYQNRLTDAEKELNREGMEELYCSRYGGLGRKIIAQREESINEESKGQQLIYSAHGVEGRIKQIVVVGDVFVYGFEQPFGRMHTVELKDGAECGLVGELDDYFVSKTDKKGFGGERFVRVVERARQRREHNERRKNIERSRSRSKEREKPDERERSRDKIKSNSYNNRWK